jgi:hypothetical protein
MLESVCHSARLSIDDPLAKFGRVSFQLHQELRYLLWEEAHIDIGFRENPLSPFQPLAPFCVFGVRT